MALKHQTTQVEDRDPKFKDVDRSALRAIVQAAVNVELFTIPLYMTTLYSIQGTHQITGSNDFYQGRLWPGSATTAAPTTGNHHAFNGIFSVFIAEMLHLQLASNICKAVGVKPTYKSPLLVNKNYGWTCYGPKETVIPHILDLKDTVDPVNKIKVSLGPLNENQIDLFIAIEEDTEKAENLVRPDKESKYFPTVPFKGWKVSDTEVDLPMFGSIGYMYMCLVSYLTIKYSDGTSLWDYVYSATALQRDIFNVQAPPPGHQAEYPGMSATVNSTGTSAIALNSILDMIEGITEQGEGGGLMKALRKALKVFLPKSALPPSVAQQFQPSKDALEADYPSYTDAGKKEPLSHDAAARSHYGSIDHHKTFKQIKKLLLEKKIVTWQDWHADKNNKWTAEMLETKDAGKNKYDLPKTSDIADALNRLKDKDGAANHTMMSHVVAGAIKGVTSVMELYWNEKNSNTFPYPSMAGSGDRMSLCWAIFGAGPDLSLGVEEKQEGVLYHACQGMSLDPKLPETNSCATVEVFHTCRGSNTCAAEGGCGFVQSSAGGGSCGGSGGGCGAPSGAPKSGGNGCGSSAGGCGTKANMIAARSNTHSAPKAAKAVKASKATAGKSVEANLCGGPTPPASTTYSAPSDNLCATYGGCAVPISASQIFPAPPTPTGSTPNVGIMELYDFSGTSPIKPPFGQMTYKAGDFVYDTAWKAYEEVLKQRKLPVPEKPKPSDIRLAFPPST